MSEKRIPTRFGVYRLTETTRVFMSNHRTENGAKHTAACLRVCAPGHVSFVVDPPHGALSSIEAPARRIRGIFDRFLSRT